MKIDNLLSAGACVYGNFTFSGGLWVDADVEGGLTSSGSARSLLVIGEDGLVRGNIEADEVVVFGGVDGCIRARKVSIHKNARLSGGSIVCEKATIEEGAIVTSELRKVGALIPVRAV
ncbi:MAG: polymer-forming cytoskeletal protein [bacterium]|nr:polymer-forming cytoskeletal protein [bacterium]